MLHQADATAVAPVERVEKSLFQFLKEKGIKWAKLSYKKGRFFLQFKTPSKTYYWANGETLQELFQDLQSRELKFVV